VNDLDLAVFSLQSIVTHVCYWNSSAVLAYEDVRVWYSHSLFFHIELKTILRVSTLGEILYAIQTWESNTWEVIDISFNSHYLFHNIIVLLIKFTSQERYFIHEAVQVGDIPNTVRTHRVAYSLLPSLPSESDVEVLSISL